MARQKRIARTNRTILFLSKPKRCEVWDIIKHTVLAYHHGYAVYKNIRFGLMIYAIYDRDDMQFLRIDDIHASA